MTWFDWTLIALLALSTIGQVLEIGKPRDPRTHNDAVLNLVVTALVICGIVML
jgi:hypothetical protein